MLSLITQLTIGYPGTDHFGSWTTTSSHSQRHAPRQPLLKLIDHNCVSYHKTIIIKFGSLTGKWEASLVLKPKQTQMLHKITLINVNFNWNHKAHHKSRLDKHKSRFKL